MSAGKLMLRAQRPQPCMRLCGRRGRAPEDGGDPEKLRDDREMLLWRQEMTKDKQ